MDNPLVSIMIPCYNGSKYIDDCFRSLLNQTYSNLEIIVIDDGSTDDSLLKLQKYQRIFEKHNMIYKYRTQKNQGQAVAVNNALKEVSGEFLMWQDIDDMYVEDAVENLLRYLQNNPDINLVRGEVEALDESLTQHLWFGKSNDPKEMNIFDAYIFETDSYCFSGIFMTRLRHFDQCIKNREIYTSRGGQNWQLILPISYNTKCGYINKVIYIYRVMNNSHSHSVTKYADLMQRCNIHKDILLNTINRIDMSDSLKYKYIKKIKHKYLRKKCILFLSKVKSTICGFFRGE